MQDSKVLTKKSTVFNRLVLAQSPSPRKATLRVAFRFFPVVLAFLLSSFCVSFLLNIQNAGATSVDAQIPLREQKEEKSTSLSEIEQQSHISSVFTEEIQYWEDKIVTWANQYNLDPNLVAVVMQIESCGHPNVHSHVGANGLFQVMPFHFSPGEDPLDPDTNAKRGLSYLSRALELAEDDPVLAMAGYNGGHSVIHQDRTSWADETKRYVYWASGILSDIEFGHSHSLRMEEWLNAGGESLCIQSSDTLGL